MAPGDGEQAGKDRSDVAASTASTVRALGSSI